MKVLVAYESRGGRTKRAAEAIAAAARSAGADASATRLGDVSRDQVLGTDLLFVGSWVEGFLFFGVGPARSARDRIRDLPSLDGKRAAVFCTYAFNPRGTLRELAGLLSDKGAWLVGRHAFHRREPEEGAREFVNEILAAR